MKKVVKGAFIGLGALILILAVTYTLLGVYYIGRFPCFTWINGIYCTGKSAEEVNDELVRDSDYKGIAILDNNGAKLFVGSTDVDYSISYKDSLNSISNNRNPFYWGVYVFKNLTEQYDPVITINRDKLSQIVSGWEIFMDPSDFECSIEKNFDGYSLENAFLTLPDKEAVIDEVYDSMLQGESVIDLSNHPECYMEYDLRSGQEKKIALFTKVDAIQNCNVSYRIDTEVITLDKAVVSDFILTDKSYKEALEEKVNKREPGKGLFIIAGNETTLPQEENITYIEGIAVDADGYPIVSESKMYAFLQGISEKYDTAWMMNNYREGKSSTVIINDSSRGDGSIFDIDSEFEHLKEEIMAGANISEERILQLSKSAVVHDADSEIGKTYIEINMGSQMLYYYVDGKLDMNMPIVTGNVNRSRGTPTGIYPVYNKRYHTNLIGVDYVSYVNYWLGVHKGIGIHDALWRKKFGDEIYKSDGSHGCINCPLDNVEKLWEVVDVGTPVVLYY